MDNNDLRPEESRADSSRVNIDDPYEVRRWCQRFVCTEAALRRAVAEVGTEPERVRRVVALGQRLRA
jgi:hypothetical protein